MPEQFHFLAPWWLLALIPLLLLAWRTYRPAGGDNPWRRVVDAALLPLLMLDRARTAPRAAPWLLGFGWTLAVVALANPAWERLPQRVYQTSAARVVVLDLSRSMAATDVAPSRLARARYRIEDILALSGEGQTGLVAYAGDAFTVSPLTRDANTIAALLRSLDPGIMPVQGARADLGLRKAAELLRHAGSSDGQVILIADGIEPDQVAATRRAAEDLRAQGYRVSVLGVAADAPLAAGTATTAAAPALDLAALRTVARDGGGEYQSIAANGDALKKLLNDPALLHGDAATSDTAAQQWQGRGPWLILLLLPIAALAFRRNWLLAVALLVGVASPAQDVRASTWDDLWQRPDQQAAKALAAGDFATAAKLAQDPQQRGSALYRLGEFDKAAESFAKGKGADADYNRGNALAKLGRYDEAIAAYDKALQADAAHEDARANKAAVERMRQQKPPPHAQDQNQPSDSSKPQSERQQDANQGSSGNGNGAAKSDKPDKADKSDEANKSGDKQDEAQAKSDADAKASDNGKPGAGKDTAPHNDASRNQFADAADRLAKEQAAAKDAQAQPADTARATSSTRAPPAKGSASASSDARPLESEEQLAAEQWLRRIPDDPGGLLRRKFLYQYRQRAQGGGDER